MARVCRAALAFVAWAALAAHVASAFVLSQHTTPPSVMPGAVTLQPCDQHTSATQQQWLVDSDGLFKSAAHPSLCLGATTQQGKLAAQSRTVTTPCRPAAADTQSWEYVNRRIISTANSSFCLMAAAGGVEATGAPVQLVDCSTSCVGGATQLCQWRFSEGGYITSEVSGPAQCLTAATQLPRTCAAASVSSAYPFCDTTISMAARVGDLVHRMNSSSKVDLVAHAGLPTEYDPKLNVKSVMWDMTCNHGVATLLSGNYPEAPPVTVLPVPIAIAATFDVELAAQVAGITASEARIVSAIRYAESGGTDTWAQVCNGGPAANIAHDPRWGRLSETYGEDPFLVGAMASATLGGLQRPNATNPFIATAGVLGRLVGFSGPTNEQAFNAVIDARSLHDSYLPPFQAAVEQANPAGVMVSYNELNGVPNAVNAALMTTLLRDTWQSKAFTISDKDAVDGVFAQHKYTPDAATAVVDSVAAGLDSIFTATKDAETLLTAALSAKKVSSAQLDTMASHLIAARMMLGEFDPAQANSYANIPVSTLNSASHRAVARDAASASVVLLKNRDNILPLDASRTLSVAVIGPNARNHATGFGENLYLHGYNGYQPDVVSIEAGISSRDNVFVTYTPGCKVDLASDPTPACFCCEPLNPGFADAVAAASSAQVAVVVVGTYAGVESNGVDRSDLLLPGEQANLIRAVSVTGTPVVVVMVNGGPLLLADDDGDVTGLVHAVVEAWYGGEEAGNGVADVLFGTVNPSGRLPVTFYDGVSQLPPFSDYSMTAPPGRTYRYLQPTTVPQYLFGYGLSYTTFQYSALVVSPSTAGPCDDVRVTVSVKNTGSVAGTAVVQLYVSVPTQASTATPRLSLQGVQRQMLSPGDSDILTFTLQPRQWSTVLNNGTRTIAVGNYSVHVGGHQPGDRLGAAESNVVAGSFQVKGPAGVVEGVHGYDVALNRCPFQPIVPSADDALAQAEAWLSTPLLRGSAAAAAARRLTEREQ